jgi:hypothetical protein
MEFGKYALDNLRFLYKKANGDDKTVGTNLSYNHMTLCANA